MDPSVIAASAVPVAVGTLLGIFTGRGQAWRFVLSIFVLLLAGTVPLTIAGMMETEDVGSLRWLQGGWVGGWLAFAMGARLTRWWRARQPSIHRSPFDLS